MDQDHRVQIDGWASWCAVDLDGTEDMLFCFDPWGRLVGQWVQEGSEIESEQDKLIKAIFIGCNYPWE